MPRRNVYEQNHARLEALIGRPLTDLRSDVAYRYRASGFMDLIVEVLPQVAISAGTSSDERPASPRP